jgi:hypothetical protein
MKEFVKKKYTIKAYENEYYMAVFTDSQGMSEWTKYSKDWNELYLLAREEGKKGNSCQIWELNCEFEI